MNRQEGTVRRERPEGRNKVHKRLLNIPEVAAYLGRTEAAVRSLINNGKIPIVRIDRRIQIDIHDLDRLIETHKSRFEF